MCCLQCCSKVKCDCSFRRRHNTPTRIITLSTCHHIYPPNRYSSSAYIIPLYKNHRSTQPTLYSTTVIQLVLHFHKLIFRFKSVFVPNHPKPLNAFLTEHLFMFIYSIFKIVSLVCFSLTWKTCQL